MWRVNPSSARRFSATSMGGAGGLVAESGAPGYVRKAVDWAHTPDHFLRPYFREATIQADLDALVNAQMADGGWPVPWPPISPACELEWRGWITLGALLTLRANGRLSEDES